MSRLAAARTGDEEVTEAGDLLDLLADLHPPWQRRAACKTAPPEVTWFGRRFNPTREESPTAVAKAICATCPVRTECLEYALAQGDDLMGIWAGTSQAERVALRRERPAA